MPAVFIVFFSIASLSHRAAVMLCSGFFMIRILCLHLAENQASYRYRVAQFLPYSKQHGVEMYPVCVVGKSYREKLKLAFESANYDYVWLQRKPLSPLLINIIARRSRLVYDFDDALYATQFGHRGRLKSKHPGSRSMVRRISYLLRRCSLIFAGSDALYRYAERVHPGHVHLVPTALGKPEFFPSYCGDEKIVTIGWIGSNGNIPYLRLIDDAAFTIQKHYSHVRFSIMCGSPPEGLKTAWQFVPWSSDAEAEWLRSIDIGVMPLGDDEWSRGKCAFKLLQYMAYGKPVLASAVGANNATVVHDGNGFLASSFAEWVACFEMLVQDSSRRKAFGEESRKRFESFYERAVVQEMIALLLQRGLC